MVINEFYLLNFCKNQLSGMEGFFFCLKCNLWEPLKIAIFRDALIRFKIGVVRAEKLMARRILISGDVKNETDWRTNYCKTAGNVWH